MDQAKKYTFGESFLDSSGQLIRPEVEKAKQQGYQEGFAEGSQLVNHEMALLMESMNKNLQEIKENQQQAYTYITESTVLIVKGMMEKIIPFAMQKYGDEEIGNFIEHILKTLKNQMSIEIKVHPDLLAGAKEKVEKALAIHETLKVTFNKAEDIARTECHITWDDGGVSYIKSQLLQQMSDALSRVMENIPSTSAMPDLSDENPVTEPEGENHGG